MRMKSKMLVLGAVLLMAWMGTALAMEGGNLKGKITKIDGAMVTVESADGKSKTVHVDPASTKKEGELKVGVNVTADVTEKGHANWITVEKAAEPKK
jgi:hypothetical protein